MKRDEFMKMMNEALKLAKKAYENNEIPVGAVITLNGEIIASAHNTVEKEKDCTCHAEINAIKKACLYLDSKTLDGCEMYVSLEPCAMCAGAIINARIKRLYVGASEPKTGSCISKVDLMKSGLFNHDVETYYGIGEEESMELMKNFFKSKRKKD